MFSGSPFSGAPFSSSGAAAGAVAGVPDAPTIGTATKGNAQAIITFTPPGNPGDSAIIDYTATSSPGGLTGTDSASPVVVTGLTNGTAYTFTVQARNTQGTGAASAASNSATPSTVPGAPTSVVAVAGDEQASVAFTAPASDGGDAITGYTATSSPGGFTGAGSGSPVVVTGLTNGVSYTFTVVATNLNGDSSASSASASVTPASIYWTDAFADFSNWRNITSTFSASAGKAVPGSTGLCVAIWDKLNDHVAHSPDYSVSAAIVKPTTNGAYVGVIGRYHKITDGNYYLAFPRTDAATDTLELYKVVEGTSTSLASSVAHEWVDNDTLTLEMVGNTIRVLVNAVEKINVTDGTFNNILGQAGLRSNAASDGSADNFSVAGVGTGVVHHTSGAVTSTTAKVAFSLSRAGTVKVEYSTDSGLSGSTTTAGTAVDGSTDYNGAITLTGLSAGTTYYYRLLVDDVIKQFTPFAKTKTVATAAGSVKLGFASCAYLEDLRFGAASGLAENAKAFTHLATAAPDVFLFNGDIGYANDREGNATTLAHWREKHQTVNSAWTRAKSLADLRRQLPTVFAADNHEYPLATGEYDAEAAQAFDEYFGNSNPAPYRSGVRYYTYASRDVGVFVLDCHTSGKSASGATDNSSKTFLGATQKQDLLDWLYTSTATVKIVVCTNSVDPWSQTYSTAVAFGTSYTNELFQIWDFIQAQRIGGVLWISGDNHYSALFKTTRSGRNNYSLCVSPANQGNIAITTGGAADADTVFYDTTHQQTFGLLTIDTSAGPPTVQMDIIDDTNAVIQTSTVTKTTLDNNLSAAAVPATPATPTALATGTTTATVSGAMPLNNGAAITSLVATSTPGSITGSVAPGAQIGTYDINVTGLTLGTAYTFTVHAVNSVGDSLESAASNSVTTATELSGAATLDDFTTTGGTSSTVVTTLSGAATLDDFTTTGGTSSALASSLSGAAMLSDFTTTGGTSGPVVLGSLVGSVRSSYPRRYSNAPGARR